MIVVDTSFSPFPVKDTLLNTAPPSSFFLSLPVANTWITCRYMQLNPSLGANSY